MKLLKASWNALMKAKQEGMHVCIPACIVDGARSVTSENARTLFLEWDVPYILKSEDEAQDLLDIISEHITESEFGKTDLELPDNREDIYLIQFSDNLIVSVFVNDSYNGIEVEKYTCIDGVILTEVVTNGEVQRFVEWAKEIERRTK